MLLTIARKDLICFEQSSVQQERRSRPLSRERQFSLL